MPMLTMLRIGLPVCPFHAPPRTRFGEVRHPVEHGVHSGTTFLPSTRIDASRGARSATWSTARFSETLIFSPRNMASMRARRPQSSARRMSSAQSLVGDPVLRVIEIEARGVQRQPFTSFRVVREQLAQMHVADLPMVLFERLPRRLRRKPSGAGRRHVAETHPTASCTSPRTAGRLAASAFADGRFVGAFSHSRKPPMNA